MKTTTKLFCLPALMLALTTPAWAKTCKDFPTQAAAQKYYEAQKAAGKSGWKKLDRDNDGRACDCNVGGNGKHCPNKRK